MKKKALWLNILIILFLLIGCGNSSEELQDLAQRMAALDGVEMTEGDENRTADLIFKIRGLEQEIGDIIAKQSNRSEFYKLLGLKYMDYQMWGLAAENFQQALSITPESSRLHYYRGVCLGQQANNESNNSLKKELFAAAEGDYLRALELDPGYPSAAYALAILYVFEMDRIYEAENILDHLLKNDPQFIKALMLRGQLYEREDNRVKAIEMYRSIVDMGRDSQLMEAAQNRLNQLGGY